jgi:hypothetical protein
MLVDVVEELAFPGDLGPVGCEIVLRPHPDEPSRLAQLALLDDHGVEAHDLGVLHSVLALDHQPLAFIDGNPVGFAEYDPPVFVFVDPDAHIVASGIESVTR